jgi:hypothetical protein
MAIAAALITASGLTVVDVEFKWIAQGITLGFRL